MTRNRTRAPGSASSIKKLEFDLTSLKVEVVPIDLVKEDENNPRSHDNYHVEDIASSVVALGMNDPLLVDADYTVIAGTGTLRACKSAGLSVIPVIVLKHLTEAQKVAFRIAHNKLCENGSWDIDRLAENLEFLLDDEFDFDLEVTGFDFAEIDVVREGGKEAIKAAAGAAAEKEESVELPATDAVPVSRLHDRFTIGDHVVVCGSAADPVALSLAMRKSLADLSLNDPPFNIPTSRISGRGKTKHGNFVQGSGELSSAEYQRFIANAVEQIANFSRPGALIMMFTAWYAILDMMVGCNHIFRRLTHICIWAKTNGGMGSPWRNAWEGILVYRKPGGRIQNNVMLGKHGRNRTDVFRYSGANVFREGRMENLKAHPTCKPTELLKDIILDVTPIGGIVFDAFLGSGSTIIAANEARRRGVGVELDPRYVDVAILRIEKAIGKPAIHHTGKTFAELRDLRAEEEF